MDDFYKDGSMRTKKSKYHYYPLLQVDYSITLKKNSNWHNGLMKTSTLFPEKKEARSILTNMYSVEVPTPHLYFCDGYSPMTIILGVIS